MFFSELKVVQTLDSSCKGKSQSLGLSFSKTQIAHGAN